MTTDPTKALQDYLRAMKAAFVDDDGFHSFPALAGSLEVTLQIIVSDVEANADPKTIEAVAHSLEIQTKRHRNEN